MATPWSAKWAVILFAGSALAIALLVGVAFSSYLLAAIAFAVWASACTVVLGIVFSRRGDIAPTQTATPNVWTLATSPPIDVSSVSDDPDLAAWLAYRDEQGLQPRPGSHLSNGWLLPKRVTMRPDPPANVKIAAAAQVMHAAWAAFGLALVGAILGFAASGPHVAYNDDAVVWLLALLCAAYDFIVLLFTRRSVRLGMPRPTLDRPATVYNVFIPVVLIAIFITSGGIGDGNWNLTAFLGFMAILGSVCANVWWFIESAQRWNLTYEVLDLETKSL